MMRKSWISAAAVGAVMMASPVLATNKAAGTSAGAGAAASGAAASAKPAKDTKYCFNTEATGTRVRTKVCQTQAVWALHGVDVEKEMKRSRR